MGVRARVCFVFCAVAFLALNLRLFIRTSLYVPLKISRHSVFPSAVDDSAGSAAVLFWCKDRHSHCSERSIQAQCPTNSTIRDDLCKETCGACDGLVHKLARDLRVDVAVLKEPAQFFCKDVRPDCRTPGFEVQCAGRAEETVTGCKASCGYCNASSFAGSNPLLKCADYMSLCPLWRDEKHCSKPWMLELCRASCGACAQDEVEHDRRVVPIAMLQHAVPSLDCKDYHVDCPAWKEQGACRDQRDFMSLHCSYTCKLCTGQVQTEEIDPTQLHVRYHANNAPREWYSILSPPPPRHRSPFDLRLLEESFCPSKNQRCSQWAESGECFSNLGFMVLNCPSECGLCSTVWREAVPSTTVLRAGLSMPTVGLGTAGMGAQTREAVLTALKLGYRHIDTAQAEEWYQEASVGQAIEQSKIPRRELFITTKLHPRDHGYESTLHMFNRSLERLQTTYIDLFLLHYAECWGDLCNGKKPAGTWRDSWKALELLKAQKKVLAIGISNFSEEQLEELVEIATEQPDVLQAHSDPLSPNWALQALCRKYDIMFVAYSSLGTQYLQKSTMTNPVLTHSTIKGIADAHNRSPAQVVLLWSLQHGQLVIPRSTNPTHMKQNKRLDFALSEQELKDMDQISRAKAPPQES